MRFLLSGVATDALGNNHFKAIHDHKDVTKTVMMLTSSIKFYRHAINAHLVQHTTYAFLWEDDRDAIIKVIINPSQPKFNPYEN